MKMKSVIISEIEAYENENDESANTYGYEISAWRQSLAKKTQLMKNNQQA